MSVGLPSTATTPGDTAPDGGPSPNFVNKDNSIWDQGYLAKAMLQMKDSDVQKLRFVETWYKPYEYEKWLCGVTRVMVANQPEMAIYWNLVESAEKTYHKYRNEIRTSRVSLKPAKRCLVQRLNY